MSFVMKKVLCLCALGAFLCMPAIAFGQVPWSDNFDAYANDSQLHGQGGWKGWDNDVAWTAYIRDDQPLSNPHSMESLADTDMVHEFDDYTEGVWRFSAWVYVPSNLVAPNGTYFLIQSVYNDGGPYAWSVQTWFEPTTNMFMGTFGSSTELGTPYTPDTWSHIEVIGYMDDNWTHVFLNGTLLDDPAVPDHPVLGGGYTWSGGVFGGDNNPMDIGAVDLFAYGATEAYFDDLELAPLPLTGACCLQDGSCVEVTGPDCADQGGTFQGTLTTCADVDCSLPPIPTVSEWGLIVMTLLVLTAGTILLARRRRPAAA